MKQIHCVAAASTIASFADLRGGTVFVPANGTEISDRCGVFVMPNDIAVFAARAIARFGSRCANRPNLGRIHAESYPKPR
jgi:hypothetical protein